ncbi:MAG TPA: hypothetical protein EYP19_00370 [Desulfobacterales bacterium]|nr:hypothetical protein [Desulfobacterales bacterium]
MITRKHISQYLEKLSTGISTKQGEIPDHVWQQLHEYIVKHYKRLDKGARAYADEIFDQLDASLERRIDALTEGRERKVLSRKLSMVRGERSPIPAVYLDTPVLENIIRHALGQPLAEPTAGNSKALYEAVLSLVKEGKLICPEDSFHREALHMGEDHVLEGLSIMGMLSGGLSFKHSQSIEDFQIFRALRGFIGGNRPVDYRRYWQDAFQKDTVHAIMKKRSSVVFKGVLALAEKPYMASQHEASSRTAEPESLSTRLRIRYDEPSLKTEQRLQERSTRHLRDLVRLGMKYRSRMGDARKGSLDGFWAGQKIDLAVSLWNHYGGKPEGLEGLASFYESEDFENVPAIKIKRDIWNAFSAIHEEGLRRVTGPADVTIISSVLPYTDIMILGRRMSDVLRDMLSLHVEFDTEVYSLDEHDLIMGAFKEIARPD